MSKQGLLGSPDNDQQKLSKSESALTTEERIQASLLHKILKIFPNGMATIKKFVCDRTKGRKLYTSYPN